MRMTLVVTLAVTAMCGSASHAADLLVRLDAESCNSSAITVGPGCAVRYRATAELSDAANRGLALFVFDLEFDGGSLSQVELPTGVPASNFAPPDGFSNNPLGFGGTPQGGRLVQVGGVQNVFNHGMWSCVDDQDCPGGVACSGGVCAAVPGLPTGTVITGVAWPGNPVVLASGTLLAPDSPGTYALVVLSPQASVIRAGATGTPVWATEAAQVNVITNLSITVSAGAPCCGQAAEACCTPDGACVLVTGDYCVEQLLGVPGGIGSTCEGDTDNDGVDGECGDVCPLDNLKMVPGVCGCGVSDSDGDGDTVPDCIDRCPNQDDRLDADGDGIPDCIAQAPIPTLSTWGLCVLALVLIVEGKVLFSLRRRVKRL